MSAVIEIRGLTKRYGDLVAVDSLELRVRKDEVFGFLGPNGAGKTTTIKSLMGLLRIDAGSVRIRGKDIQKDRRVAVNKIGYLPENMELYDNLTGRETLEFFADLRKVPQDEIDPLLERVGLIDAAERKVGGYSKGMAQRLAIAQALLGSPPILVLDEPTSGLDPEGVSLVKRLVKEYPKNHGTVFFSSHVLPNVQEVADRVGIIVGGRLRATDSVDNLRDDLKLPDKLHMVLSEPVESLIETLENSEIVESFQGREDRLTVSCESEDKRKVMKLIEDQGVIIKDFSTDQGSLEDIFLRYTKQGGGERR